jgi:hypothetical protein
MRELAYFIGKPCRSGDHDRPGNFGSLRISALEGSLMGWDRYLRLLAQEVMPKFRQHVAAKAAE